MSSSEHIYVIGVNIRFLLCIFIYDSEFSLLIVNIHLIAVNIHSEKGLFTNLAFILSDQCSHSVKIAVYDNPANTIFIDRREFTGTIFPVTTILHLRIVNAAQLIGVISYGFLRCQPSHHLETHSQMQHTLLNS